jgi:hypothetical protein
MDGEVSEDFLKAVEEESCKDMFANYQGICMQDGEVWISQRGDEPDAEPKVIALNGFVG